MGEEGIVQELHRRRASCGSKLALVAGLGTAIIGTALTNVVPVSATSGIGVFVAYADSLRADATSFPTPWAGSPATTFLGCLPVSNCVYDAGAVRIVNNTGLAVTVNAIAVHVDNCVYKGWAPATLAPSADLIVTQLLSGAADGCTGPSPAHMDTSDVGPGGIPYSGNCTADGIVPSVDCLLYTSPSPRDLSTSRMPSSP